MGGNNFHLSHFHFTDAKENRDPAQNGAILVDLHTNLHLLHHLQGNLPLLHP